MHSSYDGSHPNLMDTAFLDRLAQQLRIHKTPSCRRAINRILNDMKKRYEDGKYNTPMAAKSDFRELVEKERICQAKSV
jgi:hypothetical protein